MLTISIGNNNIDNIYKNHSYIEFTYNELQNFPTDFFKIMFNMCDLVQLRI